MQPKVSIIIPVHGVEKYLRQCLDSVSGQTLRDIEIIAVDDGSPDGCPAILDEYAADDARIRVIHQPNAGLGAAYNAGLDAARGAYVGLVESDDWVEPEMFARLYQTAEQTGAELVKCGFWLSSADGESVKAHNIPPSAVGRVFDPQNIPVVFELMPAVWSQLYRRDFLTGHAIRFNETPGAALQDLAFNFKSWSAAARACVIPAPLYHYRQAEHQSTRKNKNIFRVCDEWAEIERWLAQRPALRAAMEQPALRVKLRNYLWNHARLSGSARKEFAKTMAAEFRVVADHPRRYRKFFLLREWGKMQTVIHHDSWWIWLKYDALVRLAGLFYKVKIRQGARTGYLFGLVRVWRENNPSTQKYCNSNRS
jgi:glycosyltransferase involved in cell wall biosynthesis